MAKDWQIEVEGIGHLKKNLDRFPDKLRTNVLRSAVQAGAQEIAKSIRAETWKEGKYLGRLSLQPGKNKRRRRKAHRSIASLRYGRMRKNIKARRRRVRGGVVASTVTMGRSFWGRFFEFGTKKMRARPFFRVGYNKARARAISTVVKKTRQNVLKQIEPPR